MCLNIGESLCTAVRLLECVLFAISATHGRTSDIRVVWGAETLAVDKEGELYVPDGRGKVLRATGSGRKTLEEYAFSGGRPLGCFFDDKGSLLIGDCVQVR